MLVTVLVLGVFIPIVQATTGAANEVRGKRPRRRLPRARRDEAPTSSASARSSPRTRRTSGTVEFVSKAQAYAQERKRNPEAYELLGSNPLPDTFRVTPDEPGQRRASCATRSRRPTPSGGRTTVDPAIDEVKNRSDETQKILTATRVVKLSMGAAGGPARRSPRCC